MPGRRQTHPQTQLHGHYLNPHDVSTGKHAMDKERARKAISGDTDCNMHACMVAETCSGNNSGMQADV